MTSIIRREGNRYLLQDPTFKNDRLTKITYPDGSFHQFDYTLLDRTSIQDRAGRKTSFEFNSYRQVTKWTDTLGRTTFFEWCKCGALKRLTDPMSHTTTWRHDLQGRVKSKEYADGSKVTYLYDNAAGRLRQRVDEKLQVTEYSYNTDGSLSQKAYTNAVVATPTVSFTYDPYYLRQTSMTDGTGTTTYDYHAAADLGAGQLASITGPEPGSAISHEYDNLGRRVSTAINGVASTVTLDSGGRIASATNALGVFTYGYDGHSFRSAFESYPNGQREFWNCQILSS